MQRGHSPLNRGFSLIELLVAVLVIVMLTTVVGLNVGGGGRSIELDDEVRHMAALLGYVQSEAEMSGADHGLYLERSEDFDGTRYQGHWLRLYDQGWAEPRGSSDVLEPVTFAEGIEIALALVGDPEVEITDRDPELKPA